MQPKDLLKEHLRLTEPHQKALKRLGVETIEDLLYHFPGRYVSGGGGTTITESKTGDTVTLFGTVSKLKTRKAWKSKIPMAEGVFDDGTGKIQLIWLHQPYIAKMIPEGSSVKVSGKLGERNGKRSIVNPEIEQIPTGAVTAGAPLFNLRASASDSRTSAPGNLFPVYPETRGITSRWFYHALQKVLGSGILDTLEDPIPQNILKKYNLPALKTSLIWIHTPRDERDSTAARKRFAFQEIFLIQLKKQQERAEAEQLPSWNILPDPGDITDFTSRFPFTPTGAQTRAIQSILDDFATPHAMSRLLEGDVGSGKTFVAATTAYAVVATRPDGKDFGNLQVAYMAPTEILAQQHFESFIEFFRDLPIQIGLITSSGCRKFPSKVKPNSWTDISRAQLLKWVANGEIPILIGTHSLIQKSVKFKHLAYVVIDEQHRFGTKQRMALARKSAQIETQINADTPADPFVYKDLSYTINNVLFAVQNEIGSGHKELVYQNAVAEEFKKRGIAFTRETQIPVTYRGKKVRVYQPDFVIEDKVILELKSLPFIGEKEKKQLWSYIKGSRYHLALLANMGQGKVETIRIVFDTARNKNSRRSASNLRSSAQVRMPHFLSMTATPIPRTLALTLYGDLDLTLLDELPKGRKQIITKAVDPAHRNGVYEAVRKEINDGRQAYVICPRIDEPDETKAMALRTKSVKEETKRLKKDVFPEFTVDMLHGKMRPKEKDAVMERFAKGETQILVATSVVEVGVNVPNATVIIIEGAERFGLSQLHQLRGRVFRSSHQAYCYLFAGTKGPETKKRLEALTTARDGFELAEKDFEFRGAGELYGGHQWGITDVGMEALRNMKMVTAAREEAHALIANDPILKNAPLLREAVRQHDNIHFE